jgi:transcription elongation factor Elf1
MKQATNIIGTVTCKKCKAYYESFKVTKATGLGSVSCPMCGAKKLGLLKFKRKVKPCVL